MVLPPDGTLHIDITVTRRAGRSGRRCFAGDHAGIAAKLPGAAYSKPAYVRPVLLAGILSQPSTSARSAQRVECSLYAAAPAVFRLAAPPRIRMANIHTCVTTRLGTKNVGRNQKPPNW